MKQIQLPITLKAHINNALAKIMDKLNSIDEGLSKLSSSKILKYQSETKDISTIKYLCLHPFTFGVGINGTLSAQNAMNIAGQHIIREPELGSLNNGIAIVITGSDISQFANQVSRITEILTFPALIQANTIIAQQALLPVNKMQKPTQKIGPYWKDCHVQYFEPYFSTHALATSLVLDKSIDARARLTNVAELAKQTLTMHEKKLKNVMSHFIGSCYAIKLSGTPIEIKKQLDEWHTDSQPYALVFIIISSDANELNYLFETFAL